LLPSPELREGSKKVHKGYLSPLLVYGEGI